MTNLESLVVERLCESREQIANLKRELADKARQTAVLYQEGRAEKAKADEAIRTLFLAADGVRRIAHGPSRPRNRRDLLAAITKMTMALINAEKYVDLIPF